MVSSRSSWLERVVKVRSAGKIQRETWVDVSLYLPHRDRRGIVVFDKLLSLPFEILSDLVWKKKESPLRGSAWREREIHRLVLFLLLGDESRRSGSAVVCLVSLSLVFD